MRIRSIEIEGLWSYRDPQHVDIDGLPLLVGVGENGAGKSTLLVAAVIAALYGKFPTRTVEESITVGAARGRVSIEFALADAVYRVERTYPRQGSATGVVSVRDDAEPSGWRPVTERGVREVTAYVTDLLGMTYETAAMTWVAEQGQYGRFASAAPAERFRLLATVFGLDEYQQRLSTARDEHRAAVDVVTRVEGQLQELQDGLLAPEAAEELGEIATRSAESIEQEIQDLNADIDRIGVDLADLNASDPGRKIVEAQQAWELVHGRRTQALASARDAIARAEHDRDAAAARAREDKAAAQTRHDHSIAASERRLDQARQSVDQARQQVEQTLSRIAEAERQIGSLADIRAGLEDDAAELRADAEAASTEVEQAAAERARLKAEWDALKVRSEQITSRIDKLRATVATADHVCFTCGQHLTEEDAAALIASQEAELAAIAEAQESVRPAGIAAGAAVKDASARRQRLLDEAAAKQREARTATDQLASAQALIATKAERETQADDLDVQITAAIAAERESVDRAAADLAAAIEAADTAARQAAAAAEQIIADSTPVVEANGEPSAEETRLAAAVESARAAASESADAVDQQRQTLTAQRDAHRAAVKAMSRELGRRAEVEAARAEQRERIQKLEKRLAAAVERRDVLALLVEAYSPAGIPAMILGGVVDQLNEAVNASLERLSRGELRVQLSTVRESASGRVDNKITVYVETPTGVRAYETLSGGQKFRVDLALRTGLAKAIARGTGTPIQTFILDEGWGTLDEKGILSTVDTLHRLAEDCNVITVSHVASVADSMPARVVVTNTGGTSIAEVIR